MKLTHKSFELKICLIIVTFVAIVPLTTIGSNASVSSNEFGSSYKPHTGPLLSPNEKWLLYHRYDLDWKTIRKNPEKLIFFEGSPTKTYKTFYYVTAGHSEEKEIPLPSLKRNQDINQISTKAWSQDSRYLAYSGVIENEKLSDIEFIAIVDFEAVNPKLIEVVETDDIDDFYWTNNNLNYRPPRESEYSIYTINSKTTTGDQVNSSNFPDSIIKKRNGLFFRKDGKEIEIFRENISPNGNYILIYSYEQIDKYHQKEVVKTNIIDLKSLKTIYELPPLKSFQWSPDGNRLAYLKKIPPQPNGSGGFTWLNPSFFILDLLSLTEDNYGLGVTEDFSWGPTGRYIYSCGKTENPAILFGNCGIYIVDTENKSEIGTFDGKNQCMNPPQISSSEKYVIYYGVGPKKPGFYITRNPYFEKLYSKENHK